MIVVFKKDATLKEIEALKATLVEKGFHIHESQGENHYLIGLVGDTSVIDPGNLRAHRFVEKVVYVQEPYKKANRRFNPDDLVIDVMGHKIGGGYFSVIAGPCSVEGENQVTEIAKSVKASGAGFLRGGAFKPRTSPYSFQGMGSEGLELLLKAKQVSGLPIVTEIMSIGQLEKYHDIIDVVQIGARNMQNFDLLKEAGKIRKPVLLKRGMSATIQELLMSAEYILAGGNEQVILCERGIRSFEKETRNLLDLSAIPVLKSIWDSVKSPKITVFNAIFKNNFQHSSVDRPTDQNLLTPDGFTLPVSSAVVGANDLTVELTALNEVAVIKGFEEDVSFAAMIINHNPISEEDEPFSIITLSQDVDSFDFANPYTLTMDLHSSESAEIAKYQDNILLIAAATKDDYDKVVQYSKTFAQ